MDNAECTCTVHSASDEGAGQVESCGPEPPCELLAARVRHATNRSDRQPLYFGAPSGSNHRNPVISVPVMVAIWNGARILGSAPSRCLQNDPLKHASPHGLRAAWPYRLRTPSVHSSARKGIVENILGRELRAVQGRDVDVAAATGTANANLPNSITDALFGIAQVIDAAIDYGHVIDSQTGDRNRDHWVENMERYVETVCREIATTQVLAQRSKKP
eukprot:8672273-Pyramimonas_sp.AAC.2